MRDEEPETEEVEVSPAQELITNASAEYAETGELSSEMMEQFSTMSSQELVDAYVTDARSTANSRST